MNRYVLTQEENELAARITRLPGVTMRVIKKVLYLIRKSEGKCIQSGCPRAAVVGQTRCEHHQAMNLVSVKKSQGRVS